MNNSIQNDRAAWIPSQCNPLNPFNSVCRCCCDDKDGCNEEDIFCLEAPKCPELETRKNLEVECTKMREIGSECSFACSGDDELSGAERISCNKMGRAGLNFQEFIKKYSCSIVDSGTTPVRAQLPRARIRRRNERMLEWAAQRVNVRLLMSSRDTISRRKVDHMCGCW